MKIHERTLITQSAEAKINIEMIELINEFDVDYGEYMNILAYTVINRSKEIGNRKYESQLHEKIEEIINKYEQEYNLTYGEIIRTISHAMSSSMKYLIRYERHGNFEQEGDWA